MSRDEKLDNLQPIFQRLAATRDDSGKPLTQLAMAERLNAEGVESLSGQPWSKYSVRRLLKSLTFKKLRAADADGEQVPSLDDELVRDRIRQGWYDTPSERFIAVPITAKESGETEAKPSDASKEKRKKDKKKKKKK